MIYKILHFTFLSKQSLKILSEIVTFAAPLTHPQTTRTFPNRPCNFSNSFYPYPRPPHPKLAGSWPHTPAHTSPRRLNFPVTHAPALLARQQCRAQIWSASTQSRRPRILDEPMTCGPR